MLDFLCLKTPVFSRGFARRAGVRKRSSGNAQKPPFIFSTLDQTIANQEHELRAVAERIWRVVTVYRDRGLSGAQGRDKRPAFDKLCWDAINR
jgi:hypothetical protein